MSALNKLCYTGSKSNPQQDEMVIKQLGWNVKLSYIFETKPEEGNNAD